MIKHIEQEKKDLDKISDDEDNSWAEELSHSEDDEVEEDYYGEEGDDYGEEVKKKNDK